MIAGTLNLKSSLVGFILVFACVAGGVMSSSAEAQGTSVTESISNSVVLVIQGRLRAGAESTYQRYIEGTGPLLQEYGAEVVLVGSGLVSDVTTDAWPINAVLRFENRSKAEGFLSDPRYIRLKTELRDAAYEELHLTLAAERAPDFESPREVAMAAFEDFRSGLASGAWEPFLARLSEDFTFRFPSGQYQGVHRGVQTAREFFAFVSQAFATGLEIVEVDRVTAEGATVVFEFKDQGELRGTPYENWVAISLDVCGTEICAYREYFGKVGAPASSGTPDTEASQ